jgi:predicted nuclease of predicted toxin-antitoxin system
MFGKDVEEYLRRENFDVVRASGVGQARANDQEILQQAISDERVLVTLDAHFGDWVILPLSKHPGVIRLKTNPTTSKNVIKLLIPFLKQHTRDDFKNNLIILSSKRVKWVKTN